MQRPLLQRLIAEALGSFGLVAVGTGAIVLEGGRSGWLGNFGIALCFGLVVVAMILSFGRASGAHINPAVSWAALFAGQLERREFLPYVIAQCAGAVAASAALSTWASPDSNLGGTLPSVSLGAAFSIEVLITGLLVYVIMRVVSRPSVTLPGIAWKVGATVSVLAFAAGPTTGASMNPARSFGPAVISGQLDVLWIYWGAPMLGAWLAVQVCRRTSVQCCAGVCSSEACR